MLELLVNMILMLGNSEADCEKDLGAWMSGDLKPSIPNCKAAVSAMKVLSLIRRSFVKISKEMFIFLYKTCEASFGLFFIYLESLPCQGY